MESLMKVPFVAAFLKMLQNYFNFNDRTSRSDYWWAVLGNFIVSFVIGLICGLLGDFGSLLSTLVSLALLIPGLAMSVRRLHDIGKSWTYILFSLIPLVGGIILLIWFCKAGDPGDNMYGPDPNSNMGY